MSTKLAAGVEARRERQIASARPIDLVHLSHYTLGDRALEREVLKLFCTQSFLCLDQMRAAPSGTVWKEAAHSLKGSARAIGAWRVAEIAELAETLRAADPAAARSKYIAEIDATLRETHVFISDLLSDR